MPGEKGEVQIVENITETEDGNGVKTIVTTRTNPETGKTVKNIKKVKVVTRDTRINKAERARRVSLMVDLIVLVYTCILCNVQTNWKKFGEPKAVPVGNLESGITFPGDLVQFELSEIKQKESKEAPSDPLQIICRYCQQNHWSHQCDKHKADSSNPAAAGPGSSKYVIPAKKGGPGGKYSSADSGIVTTIRVSNLAEDTVEFDLERLFRPFGQIQRIYLARDKVNPEIARGFAYVTYINRSDAQRALEQLTGVGLHHCILNLEWAKT